MRTSIRYPAILAGVLVALALLSPAGSAAEVRSWEDWSLRAKFGGAFAAGEVVPRLPRDLTGGMITRFTLRSTAGGCAWIRVDRSFPGVGMGRWDDPQTRTVCGRRAQRFAITHAWGPTAITIRLCRGTARGPRLQSCRVHTVQPPVKRFGPVYARGGGVVAAGYKFHSARTGHAVRYNVMDTRGDNRCGWFGRRLANPQTPISFTTACGKGRNQIGLSYSQVTAVLVCRGTQRQVNRASCFRRPV